MINLICIKYVFVTNKHNVLRLGFGMDHNDMLNLFP